MNPYEFYKKEQKEERKKERSQEEILSDIIDTYKDLNLKKEIMINELKNINNLLEKRIINLENINLRHDKIAEIGYQIEKTISSIIINKNIFSIKTLRKKICGRYDKIIILDNLLKKINYDDHKDMIKYLKKISPGIRENILVNSNELYNLVEKYKYKEEIIKLIDILVLLKERKTNLFDL